MLEQKLSKIEAVLMFEDEDFEQVTGVKKQEEPDEDLTDRSGKPKVGAVNPEEAEKDDDEEENDKAPEQTP